MRAKDKEVGMTYWESPERRCLNDCRLPLPADEEEFLANRSMVVQTQGSSGKGRGGSGTKAKGRGSQHLARQVRLWHFLTREIIAN